MAINTNIPLSFFNARDPFAGLQNLGTNLSNAYTGIQDFKQDKLKQQQDQQYRDALRRDARIKAGATSDIVEQHRLNTLGQMAGANPDLVARELGFNVSGSSKKQILGADEYQRFNQAKAEFSRVIREEGLESPNLSKVYAEMAQANSDFYRATGKTLNLQNFSQTVNAEANRLKAQGIELTNTLKEKDIEKKSDEIGFGRSAEKQKLANYRDKRVDKLLDERKAYMQKLGQIKNAINIANKVQAIEDPAQLFTAVKSLAQIIEPGMAVTEGEVRGFMGANLATETISFVNSVANAAKSLGNKADMAEAQYRAGTVNPEAIRAVKSLALQLGQDAEKHWNNSVNAGTANIAEDIENTAKTIYKGTIGQQELSDIVGRTKEVMLNRLNLYAGQSNKNLSPRVEKTTEVKTDPNKTLQDQPKPKQTQVSDEDLMNELGL